nr:hypothetical protein REQ54_01625 [Rhizobium sp. Q54]
MKTEAAHSGDEARDFRKIYRPRLPARTIKCVGNALFRTQQARDYACVLDLDPNVLFWRCTHEAIVNDSSAARPQWWHVDFAIETTSEKLLVDLWQTTTGGPTWMAKRAERMGYRYRPISIIEIGQTRLKNATDLFKYARAAAPLGDRIRILAALDEAGSLTLGECLSAVRESQAMHTVASMIVQGLLLVDLDEALFGPETVVRRAPK